MPTTVLFVREREAAICFYTEFLFQEVELDLGPCVSFRSGFSIWEGEEAAEVTKLDTANTLIRGRGGMELYFEVWDVDKLYQQMEAGYVHIVHQVREQPWGQRVFRCIDPDGHFIEVAESLIVTASRLIAKGQCQEEVARMFGFALEQVEGMINLGQRLPKEVQKLRKKGQSAKEIASRHQLSVEIVQQLLQELEEAVAS